MVYCAVNSDRVLVIFMLFFVCFLYFLSSYWTVKGILFYNLQQERVEKERMKQVVLGIHERQEEEDYQGRA